MQGCNDQSKPRGAILGNQLGMGYYRNWFLEELESKPGIFIFYFYYRYTNLQ